MPSERVAAQPGHFQASPVDAGVVSSSRLGRSTAPDPLANTTAVPRRVRAVRRRTIWPWVTAGVVVLVLFLLVGGGLIWWNWTYDSDLGTPNFKGSTKKIDAEQFEMSAGGQDIWDVADQGHFYGKRVIGDFDVEVRVESIKGLQVNEWAKAGLMARADLSKGAPHCSVFATPRKGYSLQRRVVPDSATTNYPRDEKEARPVTFPSAWLRLQRIGTDFTAYISVDGRQWDVLVKVPMPDFPRVAYVGLAATSHDSNQSVQVAFQNFNYR
jgi:regulation of enolase protein 1 (concanavalin A-like superfamily)